MIKMAIFHEKLQKSLSDWRRTSGCHAIKLHQFAQHDDKIRYFSGKNFIV